MGKVLSKHFLKYQLQMAFFLSDKWINAYDLAYIKYMKNIDLKHLLN